MNCSNPARYCCDAGGSSGGKSRVDTALLSAPSGTSKNPCFAPVCFFSSLCPIQKIPISKNSTPTHPTKNAAMIQM